MNQKELIVYFSKIDREGLEIMKKKNSDYASPEQDVFKNFRVSSVVGVDPAQAVLVRIMDKICRIANIIKSDGNHKVSDETIYDTIVDARTYLAILGALIEAELIPKWKSRNNEPTVNDGKAIYSN